MKTTGRSKTILIAIVGAVTAGAALSIISGVDLPFGDLAKAKAAVRETLMDPGGVHFRSLETTPDGFFVCGEANGKNQFGAYTGFKEFSFSLNLQDVSFNPLAVRAFCR